MVLSAGSSTCVGGRRVTDGAAARRDEFVVESTVSPPRGGDLSSGCRPQSALALSERDVMVR